MLAPDLLAELSNHVSADVLLHTLPPLLFPYLDRAAELPLVDVELRALARASERAGLRDSDDSATIAAKLAAHYQAHPVDPQAWSLVQRYLREHTPVVDDAGKAARAIGTAPLHHAALLDRAPPPGAVRGALALRLGNFAAPNSDPGVNKTDRNLKGPKP